MVVQQPGLGKNAQEQKSRAQYFTLDVTVHGTNGKPHAQHTTAPDKVSRFEK